MAKKSAMESDGLELGEAAYELASYPFELAADLGSAASDALYNTLMAPLEIADDVMKDAEKWLEP